MLWRIEARVALKDGVLDAPGQVVRRSLRDLGFSEVQGVRVGKHITLEVEGPDEATVRTRVQKMGDELLANPVVETFDFEITAEATA